MEHTKLKVGEIANGFREIVDEETGGRLFYETVQTLDRAKRIVKCWNGWDGLVEALEKAKTYNEKLYNLVGDLIPGKDAKEIRRQIFINNRQYEQALAAAEEANDE